MKKLIAFLTVIIIISIIAILFISMSNSQNMTVVYTGNTDKKPIKIELGKFQDSDCGMVINDMTYASQVISPVGKTWFFHDHGGMINWIKTKNFKNDAIVWVYTKDTKRWIDGRSAWYSRTDNTPMLFGFGAYEKKTDNLITYDEMFLFVVRGEDLRNPKIKKFLLGKH